MPFVEPSIGLRNLAETSVRLQRRFESLASGSRIARAAADAAGLAISERLRALVASRGQGVRNLSDGLSATRIAEGALDETSNLLGRLRELSVQAQNGTLSDDNRAVLQQEFDALTEEISRVAGSTDFNGRALLDGSTSGADAIEFEDGTDGVAPPISLAIGDQSAASLGVDGLDVADPSTLDALDSAIASVASTRGRIGSVENRLESATRSLRNEIENLSAAESRIRDADFASETAGLASELVKRQAGVAVQIQARFSPQVVLRLLTG
ncbi:MAG: flagellin FliC [Proteobacteria bacterium]|nr:flagellin FliC [Pseudomonadota bacterium]